MGNYHVYVDSNEIFKPDPISTYYISEAERFDKDFNVADSQVRQQTLNKNETKINRLREERMLRDTMRYDHMQVENIKQDQRIETKKLLYKAGVKNQGGAAFNIVNLTYDETQEGKLLSNLDNDAMVRALLRSKVLDQKNNG